MPHSCGYCHKNAVKKCSGCRKAWYCSEECQRKEWMWHIFKCKRTKPIPPAYHLFQASLSDTFPKDRQTLEDYGFMKTIDAEDLCNLLGVYRDLFAYLEIPPRVIHGWWRKGILLQEAKWAFENTQPIEKRGPHYPWFVNNQKFLDPDWNPLTSLSPLNWKLPRGLMYEY